jgi:predicted nucleic acid-binding protein
LATSELPDALVADANVVLSAVIGGRASMVFGDVHAPPIRAADAVRNEILEWLPKLAAKRGLDLGLRLALFQLLPVTWVHESQYTSREAARRRMRARDEDDWPTVALALVLSESRSVSIWTNDKDFSAAGVDTVTTGALLDELRRTSRRL